MSGCSDEIYIYISGIERCDTILCICDFDCNLGGGLKYFLFSSLFGEMIQFD